MATALQFPHELTVESPQENATVRFMARFIFATYWAIVFTGAIRKWMFPSQTILYLLQDVPIGLSYLAALRFGLFNRGMLMLGLGILSVTITLQALFQIIFVGLSPFVAMVGLHNYLFYLPMLLVFPLCFTVKYRRDFVWWNLVGSIPMCLLAIAQAQAPKSAFINKSSEGDAFGISGADVARVAGTFNFSSFYGIWVAIGVALCVGEWLLPKERRAIKNQWLLIVCTFTINLCHLVAASRSAIALAAVGMMGGMMAALLLRSSRAILALASIVVLLPVAVSATYLISPDEYNIVMERFTGESYVSNSKARIGEGFIGFIVEPQFSMIGAGVGVGVDAAHVGSADAYNFTYTLSETDITRNVMELGTPVGMLYVLTRLFFGFGIIVLAARMVRAGSSPHVLPLAFFVMAEIYQGDLTRNAAMTASQSMLAFSFILGAYYYPDNAGMQEASGDLSTRYV